MRTLSKEKYFRYDSKELIGVIKFDLYDGRLSNKWNPRDLIIELNNRKNRFKKITGRVKSHSI